MAKDVIKYTTSGTCSKMIEVVVNDNIVEKVEFFGGCNGNLRGIGVLVEGWTIDAVIEKLQGIPCGNKPTSCPDQLAQCLVEYKSKTLVPNN